MENSRVISNMICGGVLERFPTLKVVSVESGIGWIPFMLEAIDYEWEETGSQSEIALSMKPSDYFRRQVYGCFWFEKTAPKTLVESIGEDNLSAAQLEEMVALLGNTWDPPSPASPLSAEPGTAAAASQAPENWP